MIKPVIDSDMRPHYDFTGGVRGKHYKARLRGYIIKIHKRDGTIQVIKIKRKLTAKDHTKKLS
jgi:hypothetical protein